MYVGGAAFVNLYFGPERFWMIFNMYIHNSHCGCASPSHHTYSCDCSSFKNLAIKTTKRKNVRNGIDCVRK
jgi:polygalacturonase